MCISNLEMYIFNLEMYISSLEIEFSPYFGKFFRGLEKFFRPLSLFFRGVRRRNAAGRIRLFGQNLYLWLVIWLQNLSLSLHVTKLQAFETCVTAV